jgi:UDP-2,4-diacetamido-2,4,6-trideoxy-beta-L-altropyranose hydrolase
VTSRHPASAGRLLFRPDVSPEIGTGHLMRCVSLAQTCASCGRDAIFALHACPAPLLERVRQPGITAVALTEPADPAEIAALVARCQPAAIVLDGYTLDTDYRRAVAALGLPVLAMDDGNLPYALHADIVLNSSPLARPEDYGQTAPGARLLLGPGFAPLRAEFREAGRPHATVADSDRVLVTFGGSDPADLTLPVARALLEDLPASAQLDIVLGAAVAESVQIEQLAADRPDRVTLHRNSSRMAALMAGARLAISAAGSTLWELACLAVPSIAVVVADNQAGTLRPPARDWFASVDARDHPNAAVRQIAATALALWQDVPGRAAQGARLREVGVGRRVREVCAALDQAIEGSS